MMFIEDPNSPEAKRLLEHYDAKQRRRKRQARRAVLFRGISYGMIGGLLLAGALWLATGPA